MRTLSLFRHLNSHRKFQLILLLPLLLLASLSEVLGLGLLPAFLLILISPENISSNIVGQKILALLKFQSPQEIILPFTLFFVFAIALAGLLRLFLLVVQTRLAFGIGSDLGQEVYRRTLYQPYLKHVNQNSSDLIAGVSIKASAVVKTTIMPLLTCVSSSVLAAFILGTLLAIDPVVAIMTLLGLVLIYLGMMSIFRRRLLRDGVKVNHAYSQLIRAIQEGLGGIRDVILDGTQSFYLKIFKKADLPLRDAQINITLAGSAPRFIVETLSITLLACLAYAVSSRQGGLINALPVLGALALGAQRLIPLFQQFYAGWASFRGGRASMIEVLALLEQPLPHYAFKPVSAPLRLQNRIVFKDVWFRYSPDHPWIFKGLKLNIAKGTRVGFIGKTGSGKSTCLDLIMGLLTPCKGRILVDGKSLNRKNASAWQQNIAHVPQSIYLSDSSLAENIAFGVPAEKIDLDRVREAARQAQIADFIESNPKGYQAMVGERGIRLSGGQRQRIGIARALYKQAQVLVFDEATSALDHETEKAVMRSIESLSSDLTILIIAHRASTLRCCGKIINLDQQKKLFPLT